VNIKLLIFIIFVSMSFSAFCAETPELGGEMGETVAGMITDVFFGLILPVAFLIIIGLIIVKFIEKKLKSIKRK